MPPLRWAAGRAGHQLRALNERIAVMREDEATADARAAVADDPAGQSAGAEAGMGTQAGAATGQLTAAPPDRQRDVRALEAEGDIAADYIEGLLDLADLDGDIDMDVEGDRAVVSVVGATLDELVGPQGEVLEALQELTRLAVHRQTGTRSRLMVDIGGYRERRRAELTQDALDAVERARRDGMPVTLPAMNPFERKVVHDTVADAGLISESEGEEPNRRVIISPAG